MELIMENWRNYSAQEALLIEGLNADDIFMDIVQVAVSSGAIVGTGGAGGDVVTDTLFAAKEAEEILGEVTALIDEFQLLRSIVTEAAKLDYGEDPDLFYKQVKGLLKKTVASGTIGKDVRKFIKEIEETTLEVINKIVRAISKWVSALFPDDFGLSGPAFELTLTNAITSAAENAYNLANTGINALGETGKLITDPVALNAFLTRIVQSILDYIQKLNDVVQNPDPEKAGVMGSILGTVQAAGETWVSAAMTSPTVRLATALPRGVARMAGVEMDTLAEDYLDALEKMHPKDPRRLALQEAFPPLISMVEAILAEWIPTAVAVMRKLISLLFASIAVFQMVMDPTERKEILKVETGKTDLADPLAIDDMDLDVSFDDEDALAIAESTQTDRMKLIMENWRQFK